MVALRSLTLSSFVICGASELSVIVVGDSYGDTGPTYHALDDTFKKNGVSAKVNSTAVGGTTACQWASEQNGMKLVNDAKAAFPNAAKGPDYMWFTLGANDQWNDGDFQMCLQNAKGGSIQDALECAPAEVDRITGCAGTLLENYWTEFPNSKVLFTGYDVPCYSLTCDLTFTGAFYSKFCGYDVSCTNQLESDFQKLYSTALTKRFAGRPFTAVRFMGAAQKAAGVAGASVGTPVIDQGASCSYSEYCVHPKYGTPAGDAWTDAFWDKYFSKELSAVVV
jgi:hypothetical protein